MRRALFAVAPAALAVVAGLSLVDLARGTEPAGKPNRLLHEKSPYLLQHAYNPVDWFPWGDEAFLKAKREDKPIFLSIGYSTCYWCHVMEKESFEDPDVAKLLNENFVAIKVDREERPDVDEQYMLATQLVTGGGGWPNTVWLTPDRKPWMAGTYFPQPQLISALRQLAQIWKTRRGEVDQQADSLAQAIAGAGQTPAAGPAALNSKLVDDAVRQVVARFDPRAGGTIGAPKFPPHGALALLVRQYRDTGDKDLLAPITTTLDAMWLGGMHDHIGGGFHRYSTDARWLLPHFEKMLYDNAQLARAYTDGFLMTRRAAYRDAVADIFRWIQREMTSPDGAFYSAIDSGEVGQEGAIYVWRSDQIEAVLGRQDAALFAEVYHIEKDGNFVEQRAGERTGANIPHLTESIDATAKRHGETPATFAARLAGMREKLLARRLTWPQPRKDDKILASWNGLMIGALAYAGRQLDEPRYTAAATRAAEFVLSTMLRDGTLRRSYRDGEAKLTGYLDDYAYLAQGLGELHRATGDGQWLEQADRLASKLVANFQDEQNGGFYFTTATHEALIVRSKNLGGGGNLPDANGVAAGVLLDLARLEDRPQYFAAAKHALTAMAGLMEQSPLTAEHLLLAAAEYLRRPALANAPAVVDADAIERAGPVNIRAYASRANVRPGELFQIAVALDVDEGWHLYGANPDAGFLIPSSVSLHAPDALRVGEIVVPEPHRATDAILKQALNLYTGRIWFRVPVTVNAAAAPGPVTLTLEVKTQPCDDHRCLPPATTTLRISLLIDRNAKLEIRHESVFAVP